MKKDNHQHYKKYFSNSELAEIFNYSSVDSFNRSTGSKRIKDATSKIIKHVEEALIKKLME